MTRWFEELTDGEEFALGSHTFSLEEIRQFCAEYDPQYFHVDPEQARHSTYGGIIASGWLTVCVGHRLMVDALFAEEKRLRDMGREPGVSGPSPGVNKMQFKAPVRPGDTVTYKLIVTGKRPSKSIPGWGLLFNQLDAHNQDGELVYRAEIVGFSKLRDYQPTRRERLLLWMAGVPLVRRLARR